MKFIANPHLSEALRTSVAYAAFFKFPERVYPCLVIDVLRRMIDINTPHACDNLCVLWRRFSQAEQLPQSQRKQIVQILDAFLERDNLKKAS